VAGTATIAIASVFKHRRTLFTSTINPPLVIDFELSGALDDKRLAVPSDLAFSFDVPVERLTSEANSNGDQSLAKSRRADTSFTNPERLP
jgi:hypothetical protein